jgi:nitrogen fixation protein FixH
MNTPTSSNASWWPIGIVTTFVLFAAMIFYFVISAMRTELNMVSPDYYAQDKQFDQHQAAAQNAERLGAALAMENDPAARLLTIRFPAQGAVSGAKLRFFRPSDARLDFEVPLAPGASLVQQVNTAKLAKGYWKAQLHFEQNGAAFFREASLQID